MYGQQFVPNQMYVQPNMMQYAPPQMIPPSIPGTVSPNYSQQYRGGFPQPVASTQWQQQQQQPQGQSLGQQPVRVQVSANPHAARQRNNEIGDVSRVIHLRNVTPEVTQLSIQNLAANFGNIKHVVMLRQMNQALVEMETAKSAQQLVDFFKEPGYAEVDGRRVYVRYSTHQNLTATQHVSRTLLVSMFNTQYDVSSAAQITPEIVYQIFANYGTVQRIVVLPKNESSQFNHNRVQALVQLDSKETAEHVKNILQGQPVTLGETVTFTLDIQFSRMDEIKTTNPSTSLEVDESGQTHRPQPTETPANPASTTGAAANGQSGVMQGSNNMYAMPQQWS